MVTWPGSGLGIAGTLGGGLGLLLHKKRENSKSPRWVGEEPFGWARLARMEPCAKEPDPLTQCCAGSMRCP